MKAYRKKALVIVGFIAMLFLKPLLWAGGLPAFSSPASSERLSSYSVNGKKCIALDALLIPIIIDQVLKGYITLEVSLEIASAIPDASIQTMHTAYVQCIIKHFYQLGPLLLAQKSPKALLAALQESLLHDLQLLSSGVTALTIHRYTLTETS